MLPPRLNSAQLRALAVGDHVARVTGAGTETGKVTKHSNTEIKVQWPAEVAWYYNESGSRKGTPLEVLLVAPEPLPAAWLVSTVETLDAELTRHHCTMVERCTLRTGLQSPGNAAHAMLARCHAANMSPGDTAALLVGLVLYDRLRAGDVQAADFPDPFTPTVPDWALAVACG